jgi:acetyl-CoA synthetase
MRLFERYCDKTRFDSYEDFKRDFRIKPPANFNFAYDVVDEYAKLEPEKLAMLWCNAAGEVKRFSFRDMKEASERAAAFFLSLGIKKGDKVMLILKRHFEFWYCILALHKIGAVAIPGTHLLTVKDLVYRLNMAEVKALVCTPDADFPAAVDEALPQCPDLKVRIAVRKKRDGWHSFEEGLAGAEAFTRPDGEAGTKNTDTMLLYFTSGTTGMPKMVAHDFLYPLGHVQTAAYWQNVKDNGLHLTVSDTGWAKSVWGKIYGQWLAGSAVFTYDFDKFDAKDLLEKITHHKVTTFCAPPTVYRFFIKEDLSQYDFSALEYAVTAGEALNPEVQAQFSAATGLTVREGFGQTEMTLCVATYPWMVSKAGSMGRPAPEYDIDLIKDDRTPCNPGETGEIVVYTKKGVPLGMFRGYFKSQETTDMVWQDDIYHTGDVAWKDEDGYFWYVGRIDDMIKSSGYRIGPFEVESAILEHPAVLEAAVTGVPHLERGQVVKATVVLAKGYAPSEQLKEDIQEHVKKTTAPYKYPRIVEFAAELPKTISGKIRRVEIREKDRG